MWSNTSLVLSISSWVCMTWRAVEEMLSCTVGEGATLIGRGIFNGVVCLPWISDVCLAVGVPPPPVISGSRTLYCLWDARSGGGVPVADRCIACSTYYLDDQSSISNTYWPWPYFTKMWYELECWSSVHVSACQLIMRGMVGRTAGGRGMVVRVEGNWVVPDGCSCGVILYTLSRSIPFWTCSSRSSLWGWRDMFW